MSALRIAIQQKGRLAGPSLEFLTSCGLLFAQSQDRNLLLQCTNYPLHLILVRDDDIPEYVDLDFADFGIVGENVIWGRQDDFFINRKLSFGFCSLVIAVPTTSIIKNVEDLESERIATSYPQTVRAFLKEKGINAAVIQLKGSIEISPRLNVADAICDLMQTGKTLRENNLVVLTTLLTSQAVLIESARRNGEAKEAFKTFLKSTA